MADFQKLIAGMWRRRRGEDPARLSPLAQIANRPMMISPLALDALMVSAAPTPEMIREDGDWSPHGSRPEHLVTINDGVGHIAIKGPLFKEFDVWTWMFGGTGYDMIRGAIDMALSSPDIERIQLDIDSGGGTVAGAFETAEQIFAARGQKPIHAVADDAFSAAYLLASAADTVSISQTGGAGSVGVVATHLDLSVLNSRIGVNYEYVFAGEKKVDFRQDGPLDSRAREDMQAEVDRLYGLFVEAVAKHRGLDAEAVRATKAGIYFGPLAVDVGFADMVGNPDAAPQGVAAKNVDEDADIKGDVAPVEGATPAHTSEAAQVALTEDNAAALIATSAARGLVADMIADADLHPSITKALLRRKDLDADAAEAAITDARAIDDACAAAGLRDCAPAYVEKGMSIEKVRAELAAVVADPGPEISTHLPVPGAEKPAAASRLSPSAIYLKRGNQHDRKV